VLPLLLLLVLVKPLVSELHRARSQVVNHSLETWRTSLGEVRPLLALVGIHRVESRFASIDGVVFTLDKGVKVTVQFLWPHTLLLHAWVGAVCGLEVVPTVAPLHLLRHSWVSTTLEARLIHHLAETTLLELVSTLHHHLTVSELHVLALTGLLLLVAKGVVGSLLLRGSSLVNLLLGFRWLLTHNEL